MFATSAVGCAEKSHGFCTLPVKKMLKRLILYKICSTFLKMLNEWFKTQFVAHSPYGSSAVEQISLFCSL